MGKPPLAWLAAAAASVALGVVAAVLAGRSAAAVAAWVLTGPIALGLLAVYTRADLEQQARYSYLRSPYATVVYAVVLAAAAAGVLFSGWNLADWLARR
ncbi:hypothetical protein ACTD5D_21260 [Nocardia takedensis]|uniref:hypothetical protein n=1 Tax=Nocardia takedensis TaxID=259390 RepID=UPI003F7585F3